MDVVSCALTEHAGRRYHHPAVDTDEEITEFVFSPDGDHIAWLVTQVPESALIRLLQRLLPSHMTPFQPSQSIWITRLNGSNPHELGSLAMPLGEHSMIGALHWLPDGKQVSFSTQDLVYSIQAVD